MTNVEIICDAASNLQEALEKIKSTTKSLDALKDEQPELAAAYHTMRIDSMEHVQVLTLMLTKLVTGDALKKDGTPTRKQGHPKANVTVRKKGAGRHAT